MSNEPLGGIGAAMSTISPAPGLAAHGVAFAPQIAQAAARHSVDPVLLAAVAAQETGGPGSNAGRNIVGDGGHGRGLFQIDDRFHAFARTAEAMEPSANADYAAGMIAGLLRRYGGNVREALSAYNAGSPEATGTVTTWADGSRLSYADSVLRHYRGLSGEALPANADLPPPSVMNDLAAESQSEQLEIGALAQLAMQTLPLSGAPAQPSLHSYRQLAGLDDNGNASTTLRTGAKDAPDYASIVDDSDSGSTDAIDF